MKFFEKVKNLLFGEGNGRKQSEDASAKAVLVDEAGEIVLEASDAAGDREYAGFDGWIHFHGSSCHVRNASFALHVGDVRSLRSGAVNLRNLKSNYIVWKGGEVVSGDLTHCLEWEDGAFSGGRLCMLPGGKFVHGDFRGKEFRGFDGVECPEFVGGTVHSGEVRCLWKGGSFLGGNFFGRWEGGTFEGGTFDGEWLCGVFCGGQFNGRWHDGAWKAGEWNGRRISGDGSAPVAV